MLVFHASGNVTAPLTKNQLYCGRVQLHESLYLFISFTHPCLFCKCRSHKTHVAYNFTQLGKMLAQLHTLKMLKWMTH